MSSDDTRITTDDLLTHATPVDAANLTPMDGHPWEGDVGLAATMSDAFGQTQLVFTHGQTIIWGEEIVRAQLAQPDDGGMVPAVDFAALGWSVERAQTWLLGRLSQQRRGTLDLSDLAELAAGRVTADPELASMAGWDGDQLDDVLNTLAEQQAALNTATELDDVDPGPPPADPVTRPGDVWLLGPHRLVCGDSTDPANYPEHGTVALVVTDPPYGVSYADKNAFLNNYDKGNSIQKEIENDHLTPEEVKKLWDSVFALCHDALQPGGVYYVTGPQGGDLLLLLLALQESGLILKHMLIWVKNNHVLGRCDYNYKHEPIVYGWKKGGHKFYGDGTDKSVWEIDKPHSSKLHPTMKPVELYERAIRNSSRPGETVLEPFAGSGTCVVACEAEGRKCWAVEIDPAYCDVICRRYQTTTGIKPVLESTGEPHDFGV